MPIKEVLNGKVPDFVKETPEWPVFLKWVSENKIQSAAQLKSVLNAEIKECQESLNKNMASSREGTNTRVVRQSAKKLSFLKLVQEDVVKKYL